jgi:YNFM family putative membrane transporter
MAGTLFFYLLAGVYAVTAVLVIRFLPKGRTAQSHASIWEPFKQIGHVLSPELRLPRHPLSR